MNNPSGYFFWSHCHYIESSELWVMNQLEPYEMIKFKVIKIAEQVGIRVDR